MKPRLGVMWFFTGSWMFGDFRGKSNISRPDRFHVMQNVLRGLEERCYTGPALSSPLDQVDRLQDPRISMVDRKRNRRFIHNFLKLVRDYETEKRKRD